MRNLTESMAGRAAVLQLLPMSARETPKVSLSRGGFPEVLARPAAAGICISFHLQTYLERDVWAIIKKPLKWEARNLPECFRRDCLLHRW